MTEDVKTGRIMLYFRKEPGSRNGNRILEFKAGTFKSAVNAGCPHHTGLLLIDSYKPFDVSSINKETVQVHFLEPLNPDQYVGLKTKEIADIVHDRIQNKIDENI